MDIQKLADECIKEIEEKSFCILNTVFSNNVNMQESDRFQLIYLVCKSGKYRLDLTPNVGRSDKSWVLLHNPDHELSEDVAKTNESVRKVNKWFIATIIFSGLALVVSLFGLDVQYRQLSIQAQQLEQSQKPQLKNIQQPVPISIPLKDTLGVSPSTDTESVKK